MKISRFAPLFAAAFFLAACDEEQVLYTHQSDEPIPEVPEVPAAMGQSSAPPPQRAVELPPMEVVEFGDRYDGAARLVRLVGLAFDLPRAFEVVPTDAPMRAAQYRVTGEEGAEAELIAYHFGRNQGGSAEQNAVRWAGQFEPEFTENPIVRYEQQERGELTLTRLTLEGVWNQPAMPGMVDAPTGPQPGWAMDAVIVEGGPRGPVFFRLTGPRRLVRAQSDAMEAIAATIGVDRSAPPVADAAAAAPDPAVLATPAPIMDGEDLQLARVDIEGVSFAIPADWQPEAPDSSMRALQFSLPGEGGAGPGELVVFYFGPGGSGEPEANIDRWIGQVSQPDGSSSQDVAQVEKEVVGDYTVHQVRVTGSYATSGMGPMAPAPDPEPGTTLVGMVVEGGPAGPFYVRVTGPEATIERWTPQINGIVASLVPTERVAGQ